MVAIFPTRIKVLCMYQLTRERGLQYFVLFFDFKVRHKVFTLFPGP